MGRWIAVFAVLVFTAATPAAGEGPPAKEGTAE